MQDGFSVVWELVWEMHLKFVFLEMTTNSESE